MSGAQAPGWAFPGCPAPPGWPLGWAALLERYGWLGALAGAPQNPDYHAEGDVLAHTRMVAESLAGLPAWRALAPGDRQALFAAALLHDIAKPVSTVVDAAGRISSPGHARRAEQHARTLLWRDAALHGHPPPARREQVARLVRHHGLPLWWLDKAGPERAIVAASQTARLDHVALLAEADVRGRVCAGQPELLARIDLFRAHCAELGCYVCGRVFLMRKC